MKLFDTSNMEMVKCCQEQLNFELPSDTLARRTDFFDNLIECECDKLCHKNTIRL